MANHRRSVEKEAYWRGQLDQLDQQVVSGRLSESGAAATAFPNPRFICGDGNCGSVISNVDCPVTTLPNVAFKDDYQKRPWRRALLPWTW